MYSDAPREREGLRRAVQPRAAGCSGVCVQPRALVATRGWWETRNASPASRLRVLHRGQPLVVLRLEPAQLLPRKRTAPQPARVGRPARLGRPAAAAAAAAALLSARGRRRACRRLRRRRRGRRLPLCRRPRAYWNDPSGTRLRGGAPKGRHAWHVGRLGRSLTSPRLSTRREGQERPSHSNGWENF